MPVVDQRRAAAAVPHQGRDIIPIVVIDQGLIRIELTYDACKLRADDLKFVLRDVPALHDVRFLTASQPCEIAAKMGVSLRSAFAKLQKVAVSEIVHRCDVAWLRHRSRLLLCTAPTLAAELHYAPAENLEAIDARVLGKARKTIDIAAYVLTDWPVINAIASAARHGAVVRLYIDGAQAGSADMSPDEPFGTLLRLGTITVKQKRVGAAPMHLKSYCVDGRWFRTGSANFTRSGLTKQDNDLLLFDDRDMCPAFTVDFERVWAGGDAE